MSRQTRKLLLLAAVLCSACSGGSSGPAEQKDPVPPGDPPGPSDPPPPIDPPGPAGPVITYEPAQLLEGNRVVFDGSRNEDPKSFRWSYRRATDAAFSPMPWFDGWSWIPVVFAEPGAYAIRLAVSDAASSSVEFTVAGRTIDLGSLTIDPDRFVGAFAFTRAGEAYDVSLRLNEVVLGLIRSGSPYLFFDAFLGDLYGNAVAGYGSYESSEGGSASGTLEALAGVAAPDVPDVIRLAPLGADAVKRLGRVDHLVCYLTDELDGEPLPDFVLQVEYFAGRFFLVIPDDPPDRFYVLY